MNLCHSWAADKDFSFVKTITPVTCSIGYFSHNTRKEPFEHIMTFPGLNLISKQNAQNGFEMKGIYEFETRCFKHNAIN